jgi:hypothetical protein
MFKLGEIKSMLKKLITLITVSTVLIPATLTLAAKSSSFYFPDDNFCAVYQGKIEEGQSFPIWVERNRQLIIKTDKGVKIAVAFQNRILPAYQIDAISDDFSSQYFYKTSQTGNHLITVKGVDQNAQISFCLQ